MVADLETTAIAHHWPRSVNPGITYRIIDPHHWPSLLPVRVPLTSTLSQYTEGHDGKVTSWFNPAVVRWKGVNWVSYRCECYPFWKNGRSGVGQMDDNWNPVTKGVDFLPLPGRLGMCESQDARFVIHENRLLMAYNTGWSQRMAWLTDDLRLDRWLQFRACGMTLTPTEKNWSFISHDGDLYCLYTQKPHTILKVCGDVVTPLHDEPWRFPWKWGTPRGGATPVLHNGLYHHFFHSSTTYNDESSDPPWMSRRRYHMGLALMEPKPPFKLVSASRVPIASGWNVEDVTSLKYTAPSSHAVLFPGSAHRNDFDNGWVIACGINDQHSYFLYVPDSLIEEILE